MTSSNVIAESAPGVDVPADTPEAVDGGPAPTSNNTSPFEFLPAGDAFGVCALDGECA